MKKTISAILMLLLFIPILYLGGLPFTILMTALSFLGLYELLHLRESKKAFPFVMKIFSYIMVLILCISNEHSVTLSYILDYRIMSFLIFAFLLPILFVKKSDDYTLNDALFLIGSTLFIGLSFNLLIVVRHFDLYYLIYLFLITIFTDTFAFFIGKQIGRIKLAERISPKKTVEGLIGGVAVGSFVAVMFYHTVINPGLPLWIIILVTVALSVIGQLGDLVFSSIKRSYDKKDFSELIPGHGGILDRLDSMVFVVLAFIIFLTWI